jgi:hypothetical protein
VGGGLLLIVAAMFFTFATQEDTSSLYFGESATPPASATSYELKMSDSSRSMDGEFHPAATEPNDPFAGAEAKPESVMSLDEKLAMPTPSRIPLDDVADGIRKEELAKKTDDRPAFKAAVAEPFEEAEKPAGTAPAAPVSPSGSVNGIPGPVDAEIPFLGRSSGNRQNEPTARVQGPADAPPAEIADSFKSGLTKNFGYGGAAAFAQAPGVDFAPPATPAAPPGAQPAGKGLLSLSVNLQPPAGSRTETFQYFGAPPDSAVPELVLGYQNREKYSFLGLAWQAGLLLVFWFARNASPGVRGALGALGLAAPVALAPIVPLDVLPHLDGIFLGTIWGLLLWGAIVVFHAVREPLGRLFPGLKPSGATTAMLLAAGVIAAIIGSAPVRAQEQPAAAPQTKVVPPRQALVIPYDLSEDPRKSERVYLPFDEFLQLWNGANPDKRIDAPPMEAIVAEALYAAELKTDGNAKSARLDVTARYVVHSFVKRQVTVALPLGTVGLSSGQLDGKSAPIVARETGGGRELAVVLDQPGAHVLDVTFAVPVELTGPAGKVTLPLKPVSSGTLRFVLPADQLVLRVSGAGVYRQVKENERPVAVIPVDQSADVTLSWAPSQKRDAAEQATVQAETNTAILVEDTGISLYPTVQLQVRQGTTSETAFSLPEGLLVRHIAGPDLGGWEITGTGAERALKVFLRRAVDDNTRLSFDLFQPVGFTDDGATVAVPAFAPLGAARETGTLGLYVEGQLNAAVVTATGLTQIDVVTFAAPGVVSSGSTESAGRSQIGTVPPQVAYRYTRRPFDLSLLVSRRKPQAKVVAEHAVLIGTHKAVAGTRFELTLADAPRSQLTVHLPFGFLLYDLKSRDVVDYFVESPNPEQGSFLHLDLSEPRTGQLEFIVEGIIPRDPEDLAPVIGFPALVGVSEQRAAAAVWIDAGYTAVVEDSPGWKGSDPAQLSRWLISARSTPAQFAFTSSLTALQPVTLALTRTAARLNGDALTVVIARDTATDYALHLRWKIAQARENRFSFTGPEWLEGGLDFTPVPQAPRVRQVLTEKIANGRTRWTIVLDDYQSETYFALAQATLPPPKGNTIDAPQILFEQRGGTVEEPTWQPLETQSAHLMLINQSSATLAATEPSAVAPEPADELPIRVSRALSDQAAEIAKVTDTRTAIGWSVQSRGQAKASSANVNLTKISLVLARDGSWRELVEYRIQNRGRQFLALQMPEKAPVLSLFVAGRPARPVTAQRDGREMLLVPLPKTSAADLSVEVKLVCAGRLPGPLPRGVQVFRSDVDLPAPQVVSAVDNSEYGMPVAATEWTVYLPEEIDARRIDDPDRTNVAATVAGYEDLMAGFRDAFEVANYMIELKGKSRFDLGLSSSRRNYAQNNLKQIGRELQDYQSSYFEKGFSSSQQQEVASNFRKLAELEQQIQQQEAESAGEKSAAVSASTPLSATTVQQDIIAFNRGDFEVKEADKQAEQFRLELQNMTEGKAVEKAGEDARRKSAENPQQLKRQELRNLNAAQSAQINAEAAKQQAVQREDSNLLRREQELRPPKTRDRSTVESWDRAPLAAERYRHSAMGDLSSRLNTSGANPISSGGVPAGGLGGGGFGSGADGQQSTGAVDHGLALWTSSAGLSLDINIPQNGHKLTFSKSGGDARLALGLRPRASLEAAFNLLWAILWLGAALGVVGALARRNSADFLRRRIPLFLIALGLAWYFLMPAQFIGFTLFIIGGLSLGWQYRQRVAVPE